MQTLLVLAGLLLLSVGAWYLLSDAPPAPLPPAQITEIDQTISFEPMTDGDVQGGEATTLLPGTPEEILAAITDFEAAAAHRSFAKALRVLSRDGDVVEVELTLKGRMGVNPKIHVTYTTTRATEAIEVSYKLKKKALGIARYEGRYRIESVDGTPARSRFRSRIFLSSGISLMKIDHEDIEEGQRRDQAELRLWMEKRLGAR